MSRTGEPREARRPRRRHALTLAAVLFGGGCAGIRFEDIEAPRPLPDGACLAIGFLGGRDRWDDDTKGVRMLALKLRRRDIFAETFENRRRDVALALVRSALDGNGDGRLDGVEAGRARLVVYGQSFGGAAVVKLARQLEAIDVPVTLTVQVDSVGREDGVLPVNVQNAANLFQEDGWFIKGERPIRALDSGRTRILGNWRFEYRNPPASAISLAEVPWWKLAFRVAHARMDRDPEVWRFVRRLVEAACRGDDLEAVVKR